MKEYLRELIGATPDPWRGRHLAREYLQARILGSMQRAGATMPLAFHGGTALRFLYRIPRYSEDLDFALENRAAPYDFPAYMGGVRSDLQAENYPVEIRVSVERTVHSGLIRFRGLLHNLGLSSQVGEGLTIKVEVDTNPPAGAGLDVTVVRRHVPLRLQHHDRASLLSGKLHAILQRPYAKGRDLYDLLWYLSDPNWPAPNFTMLNHALAQTEWTREPVTEENWRPVVLRRLGELDWRAAVNDVRPFLMDSREIDLLTFDTFTRLLSS
jgi:hypothetical protein